VERLIILKKIANLIKFGKKQEKKEKSKNLNKSD
jgi:hypothetical protein